jgi:hypothetical protein
MKTNRSQSLMLVTDDKKIMDRIGLNGKYPFVLKLISEIHKVVRSSKQAFHSSHLTVDGKKLYRKFNELPTGKSFVTKPFPKYRYIDYDYCAFAIDKRFYKRTAKAIGVRETYCRELVYALRRQLKNYLKDLGPSAEHKQIHIYADGYHNGHAKISFLATPKYRKKYRNVLRNFKLNS